MIEDITLAPFVQKLRRHSKVNDREAEALLALPYLLLEIGANQYVQRESSRSAGVKILLNGFVYCFQLTGGRERQISSLYMAGDALNLHSVLIDAASNAFRTCEDSIVAEVDVNTVLDLASRVPSIARALWRDTIIDARVCTEWLTNTGRRDARTRIAHLLCEIAVRQGDMKTVGGGVMNMPMTQEQIGDCLGLTPVHVNRKLREFQSQDLILVEKKRLTITDWRVFREEGDFQSNYLLATGR